MRCSSRCAICSPSRSGGTAQEYLPLHQWFDESKARFFGPTIVLSTGRIVAVRLIGREAIGFIPSFADWVRCIRPKPWMGRAQPIHRDVDPFISDPRSRSAESQ
jgi:hypothetical protein